MSRLARTLGQLIMALAVVSSGVVVPAMPSHATVCIAHALAPYQFQTKSGEYRIRYRGAGECSDSVNGIRVHIHAIRDGVDINSNESYIDQNTCGGVTHPTNILRCPKTGYFAISTQRASGCHLYNTRVWIDVVFGGGGTWWLRVDEDVSYGVYIGPGC